MRRLRSLLPDFIVALLFFIFPLLMFSQQTLGSATLLPAENLYQDQPYATYKEVIQVPEAHNHLLADLVLENYQWKSFTRSQIAQGEIPLWNPHQFSGIPFFAAGQQSILYPPSLLYYLLDLPAAYGWFTVFNLWLAALFMYAFARGIGQRRDGALIAGVIYQLSGFVLASVVFPMIIGTMVWLPLILLMIEFIIHRKPLVRAYETAIPWFVIASIAIGVMILAGHIELTLYTLMIAGFYALGRLLQELWQQRDFGHMFRSSGWLLAMLVLGFGLAAVQFIPLLDFVKTNWRDERNDVDLVLSYAHPVRDLLQFALPNFYGSPAIHSYTDLVSGQPITELKNSAGEAIRSIDWGIKNYVEAALYLGILPLLLSLYALLDTYWRRKQRPIVYQVIFLVLGLVSLSFMFGLPTYRLIYLLPGFNQLNSPFRWIYGLGVAVSLLAGFGWIALLERVRPRIAQGIGIALLILSALLLLGLLIIRVALASFLPLFDQIVSSMAKANQAFADGQAFISYQFPYLLLFTFILLLSGVIFLIASRSLRPRQKAGLSVAAAIFIALDLMLATWGFNPASDPAWLDFVPPTIEWMQTQEGDWRYTSLDDPAQGKILNANVGLRYGLDDIRGYDSIISRQYVDYMRALAPQVQLDFNRIAPFYTDYGSLDFDPNTALNSPLLDLLNVRFVVSHKSTDIALENYALVHEDEALRVWENQDTMPRIYAVSQADFKDEWLHEAGAEIDYSRLDTPDDYQSLSLYADTGREKWADVSLEEASWVVLSETYADGWRVFIRPQGGAESEEKAAELSLVLGNFMGLALDAGQYTLRFVYSPVSFQIGLFASLISGLLILLMLGIWFWRMYVGVNSADDETSSAVRVARNSLAPIILNLFNRGIDFAFAIVMLRILSPEEVGLYYYAVVIFVWFDIFTNFGLDLFLMREASRNQDSAGYYFFNTTFLRVLLSLVGIPLLVGFLLIRQATIEPTLDSTAITALILLYIGLFPASLSKGMTSLFYAREQAEYPAAIATITTVNKVIMGVMVLIAGFGIIGLAGVSILNNFITLAVLLWTGRHLIGKIPGFKPNLSLMGRMLRESWPLMLNHFLATIFFQVDIVILEALKGARIVGQYSVAYRWLLAINIIPAFFTQALFPLMSRQAHEDREALKRTYQMGIKILFAIALPLAVFFTFAAEVLTAILGGSEYLPEGAIALQLMIWSIPIGWMNSLTQYVLVALDLQRTITRAFFLAVTFNMVVNLILIPQFGFQAAALTTIASEFILFIPFIYLIHRALGKVDWLDLLWRPIVSSAVMILICLILSPFMPTLLAVIPASIVYLVLLSRLKPLSAYESQKMQEMLPKRLTTLPVIRWAFLA